mgnify:CR=1 FL=1
MTAEPRLARPGIPAIRELDLDPRAVRPGVGRIVVSPVG